jgi:type III secretory pathway lipoprotein EscJ
MAKVAILLCFISFLFANTGCKNSSDSKKHVDESEYNEMATVKESGIWAINKSKV